MKILITGSGGMLGRQLCRVLSGKGNEISGMDIAGPEAGYPAPDVFYPAGIDDPDALSRTFAKATPDVVIHAAAWTDVDGCESDPAKARSINSSGALNVAQEASKGDIPLVFISTDFVFDGNKDKPYIESDECQPLGVYAASKYGGEKAIERTLKDYAILRTSWLYGPGGKNFVDTIIHKGFENGKLRVVNDQVGSPTYTKDLALAIKKLVEIGIKGAETYHVCNSGYCSWYDLAVKIKENVPGMKNVDIEPVSAKEFARPAPRPHFSVMDNGKFSAYTGMIMRDWQEALSDYISSKCWT